MDKKERRIEQHLDNIYQAFGEVRDILEAMYARLEVLEAICQVQEVEDEVEREEE